MTSLAHPLPLPRTAPGLPGWRPTRLGHAWDAEVTCLIARCRRAIVVPAREINGDGTVAAAVSCGCGWSEWTRLEGWDAFLRSKEDSSLIGGRDVPDEDEDRATSPGWD